MPLHLGSGLQHLNLGGCKCSVHNWPRPVLSARLLGDPGYYSILCSDSTPTLRKQTLLESAYFECAICFLLTLWIRQYCFVFTLENNSSQYCTILSQPIKVVHFRAVNNHHSQQSLTGKVLHLSLQWHLELLGISRFTSLHNPNLACKSHLSL